VKVAFPLLVAALLAAPCPASAQNQRITATSPFLGGVPSRPPSAEPLKLTVLGAIQRALDHNLGVLTAEDAIDRANGARWKALAALRPDVRGLVQEQRQKINLAAFGFGAGPNALFPDFPAVVGPFNVFDARLFIRQSVFSMEAINDARSEGQLLESARLMRRSARDLVIDVAGSLFLQALAASARADAARAQLETADALYMQAQNLRQGGIIAGIDVLRAQVQQSAQQQRVTAAVNDFEDLLQGGVSPLQPSRVAGGVQTTHLRTAYITNTSYDNLYTRVIVDQVFIDVRDYILDQNFLRAGNTAAVRARIKSGVEALLNERAAWIATVTQPDGSQGYNVTVTSSPDNRQITVGYQGTVVRGISTVKVAANLSIPA
jgi:hypothetical protein